MTDMNPLERLLASAKGATRGDGGDLVIQNDAYSVNSINLNVVSAASK